MAVRLGIDTGGTFTDLAVLDEVGEFKTYKSPTTPKDYAEGILNCIRQYAIDRDLDLNQLARELSPLIVHGSILSG